MSKNVVQGLCTENGFNAWPCGTLILANAMKEHKRYLKKRFVL